MCKWNEQRGWTRHCIFGLREEWLELYLSDRNKWLEHSTLGNRQIESLQTWLKTAGIEKGTGELTLLGEQFDAQGTACLLLWELLWVNVVFSFPTAGWYVHLGKGKWTTTELRQKLGGVVPRLSSRTISNAIMELVGLLEHTPVGTALGQGRVTGERPRRVIRCGMEKPSDAAIISALEQLYRQQGQTRLTWDSDLTWPWVIFACERLFVLGRLMSMEQDYFDIDEQGVTIKTTDKEWWQCGGILTI